MPKCWWMGWAQWWPVRTATPAVETPADVVGVDLDGRRPRPGGRSCRSGRPGAAQGMGHEQSAWSGPASVAWSRSRPIRPGNGAHPAACASGWLPARKRGRLAKRRRLHGDDLDHGAAESTGGMAARSPRWPERAGCRWGRASLWLESTMASAGGLQGAGSPAAGGSGLAGVQDNERTDSLGAWEDEVEWADRTGDVGGVSQARTRVRSR